MSYVCEYTPSHTHNKDTHTHTHNNMYKQLKTHTLGFLRPPAQNKTNSSNKTSWFQSGNNPAVLQRTSDVLQHASTHCCILHSKE